MNVLAVPKILTRVSYYGDKATCAYAQIPSLVAVTMTTLSDIIEVL